MKFRVNSLLAGNLASETGSLETPSPGGEAPANLRRVRRRVGRPETQPRKAAPARTTTTATKVATAARGRGRRTTTASPAGGKPGSSSLSDRVLALATGKTQQEIAAACKG